MTFKTIILFASLLSINANAQKAQEANIDSTKAIIYRLVKAQFNQLVVDDEVLKIRKISDPDTMHIQLGGSGKPDEIFIEFKELIAKKISGKPLLVDTVEVYDGTQQGDDQFWVNFKFIDQICFKCVGDELAPCKYGFSLMAALKNGRWIYRTVMVWSEQFDCLPTYIIKNKGLVLNDKTD